MLKKLLLIVFIPLASIFAEGEIVIDVSQNFSLGNHNILILQDGSIWKIFPLTKNKQGWTEWWNGVHPDQPNERFFFDLSKWDASTTLQIHSYSFRDSEVAKIYRSKQDDLKSCNYLLENVASQDMIFAKPIKLESIVSEFFAFAQERYEAGKSSGYNLGYNSGYTAGKSDGYSSGYNSGYTCGNKEGIKKGINEARKEMEEDRKNIYNDVNYNYNEINSNYNNINRTENR